MWLGVGAETSTSFTVKTCFSSPRKSCDSCWANSYHWEDKTCHEIHWKRDTLHYLEGYRPFRKSSETPLHCTHLTKTLPPVIYGQMLVGELQLFSPFCPLQSTGWAAALVPAVAVCIYPFNDRRCVLILTQLMMWIGWRRIIYKLLSISRMSGGPRISNREVQAIIILL